MTGHDLLAFAGKLVTLANAGPVAYRTAINRAYYGAFHLVRDFLTTLGANPGVDHGQLQRLLFRAGHPKSIDASRLLATLQSYRVKADYRLQLLDAERASTARFCVETAHDLVSALTACANEPALTEMKARLGQGNPS